MRDIKFRAWFDGQMYDDKYINKYTIHHWLYSIRCPVMQFAGLLDKNGKEIYESDIFRVEEQDKEECGFCEGCGWYEGGPTIRTECEHCGGTGIIHEVDIHYYLVVTWVKEWCMFCVLRIDEYHDYLEHGIEALDEPMFWTYTLEDTDSRKFFLCGNIHQNPELLN